MPDNGEFGVKHRFGERLAGLFLRAGLQTLNDHPDWAVTEAHVHQLLTASIAPLLDDTVFPDDITTQMRWEQVCDTFMGPVAAAALSTVAEHQSVFLGDQFDTDKAMGAVTRAFFLELVENQLPTRRLDEVFTREGLFGLYSAENQPIRGTPRMDSVSPGDAENYPVKAIGRRP